MTVNRAKLALLVTSLFLLLPRPSFGQPAEKIILDTDTAFFADDGVALAMLLQRPDKVTLQAMTIVSGNYAPLQGVEYMLHVLDLMHRTDIPVYLGADHPMRNNSEMADKMAKDWGLSFKGAFGRKEIKSRSDIDPPSGGKFSQHRPEKMDAVTYLVESLERSKEPVTLVAIGPLTNLAQAIQKRASIIKKIRRLVLFGGAVHVPGNVTPYAEFNFWFDPEAADFVLKSSIKEKILIGLDLTNQAAFDKSHFDQIISGKTPLTELFKEDRGTRGPKFLTNSNATTFIWDALAAGYLIDPSIITKSERLQLAVVTKFGPKYGAVEILKKPKVGYPVTVLTGLDFDKFFGLFKSLLTSTR